MSYAHHGSIQMAVGETLRMIRVNIEQNDVEGVSKFVRDLVGLVSIYEEDHPAIWLQIKAIPPYDDSKETAQVAFEDEMQRRDLCLKILRKENLFGYTGMPAFGNADFLLEKMKEEEIEEEEAA